MSPDVSHTVSSTNHYENTSSERFVLPLCVLSLHLFPRAAIFVALCQWLHCLNAVVPKLGVPRNLSRRVNLHGLNMDQGFRGAPVGKHWSNVWNLPAISSTRCPYRMKVATSGFFSQFLIFVLFRFG